MVGRQCSVQRLLPRDRAFASGSRTRCCSIPRAMLSTARTRVSISGSNILTGPYRGGLLPTRTTRPWHPTTVDYVGVTDFSDYQPADEPTAWMVVAGGLQEAGRRRARAAVPDLQDQPVDDRGQAWEAAGMGKTGETFLVGPDGLMRSDSRLFLGEPRAVQAATSSSGNTARRGRGLDPAKWHHAGAAGEPPRRPGWRSGARRGTIIEDDYLGHQTLQAYAPWNTWRPELVDRRQDRHLRGIRAGRGIHPHTGGVDGFDHFRRLSRRDAAGAIVRSADPSARGWCPTDQFRRLQRQAAGAVARRIRRSDSGVQRHEPQPRHQGGTAHRATSRERPIAAVADARARGAALSRG